MKRRAFLLVTVLLLTTLLATFGMALLASRGNRYQSAAQSALLQQARWLARSGVEDARCKLARDLLFPPRGALGQKTFVYSEWVFTENGQRVGSYEVELDTYHAVAPYHVVQITSTGRPGSEDEIRAEYRYKATIDLNPASPTVLRIVRWDDLGAP